MTIAVASRIPCETWETPQSLRRWPARIALTDEDRLSAYSTVFALIVSDAARLPGPRPDGALPCPLSTTSRRPALSSTARARRPTSRACSSSRPPHGTPLRPHAKTHKLPAIAQMQIEAGAIGICCAKLGEAEVFADAGIADIRLPYPVHPSKSRARPRAPRQA